MQTSTLVILGVIILLAVVALVDAVVIIRRKLRGEPG